MPSLDLPAQLRGTFGGQLLLQGYHTHGGKAEIPRSSSQEHLNPKARLIAPSSHGPGLQLALPHVSNVSHVPHGLWHSTERNAAFPQRGGFVHMRKAQGLGTTAREEGGKSWECPLLTHTSPAPQVSMPWGEKVLPWGCCARVGVPQPLSGAVPSPSDIFGASCGLLGDIKQPQLSPTSQALQRGHFLGTFPAFPMGSHSDVRC